MRCNQRLVDQRRSDLRTGPAVRQQWRVETHLEIGEIVPAKSSLGETGAARWEGKLRIRRILLATAVALSISPALAGDDETPGLNTIDVNDSESIDLLEAKTAASAMFDRLEKDNNNALDRAELRGRLSAEGWKKAGPEGDNSLTRSEYVAYVEKVFDRADANHDGKVDAAELKTPEGQALLRLIMK